MATTTPQSEYRYERKYVLKKSEFLSFYTVLKLHPAHFKEIYYSRQINNIYYDTADLAHFRENIAGVSPRKKVRVRWYGRFEEIKNPSLEIKAKNGEVVKKLSSKINPDFLSQSFTEFAPINMLQNTYSYKPVLLNSYVRRYFINQTGTVRLTIDTQLLFGNFNQNLTAPTIEKKEQILELKYGLEAEDEASAISKSFPYRLEKSSKYEKGIAINYPHYVIL